MPLPLPSFTKSKWLAFFAELTAKIHHHNPSVVIEGCEMVRRILATRVSVGMVLEEGTLLQYLLDVISGLCRVERPATPLDMEMIDALLRTLWVVVDMMSSLVCDGDKYYTLLVVSRSANILKTMTTVMQHSTRLHYGRCSYYAQVILTMPLSSVWRQQIDTAELRSNITLQTHITALYDTALQLPAVLEEFMQVNSALVAASTDTAIQHAAFTVAAIAARQCQAVRKHLSASRRQDSIELHDDSGADTSTQHGDLGITPPATLSVTHSMATDAFEGFKAARSHTDFFETMNRVWCFTTAARNVVADSLSLQSFNTFSRFLKKAPTNHVDRVLFDAMLSWIAVLGSVESLHREVLDELHAMVDTHFILYASIDPSAPGGKPQQQAHQYSHAYLSTSSTLGAGTDLGNQSSHSVISNPLVTSFRSAGTNASASCESSELRFSGVSVVVEVLSFMVFLERSVTPDGAIKWAQSGLLGVLEDCIRNASGLKSILIDAPTTTDGALSDESYLQCAMESARSPVTVVAVTACKLLASMMSNFGDVLSQRMSKEMTVMGEVFIPQLLSLILKNPTLSAAEGNRPGSILHHVNRCHRAARSTSVGECAAGALDACLTVFNPVEAEQGKLREILLLVPALNRATKFSVIPHIRAVTYRLLVRLCCAPAHLVLIVRELPSIVSSAVTCVQEVRAEDPQWECAAAAEWLHKIIAVASMDPSVERNFDLSQTVLPMRLLHLTTALPVSYAASAFLLLSSAIFEQQRRLAGGGDDSSRGQISAAHVLAPLGRKSLASWTQLLHTATSANQSLQRVAQSITPTRTSTRDVFSRALAVYEDIAAQFAYTANVARGLQHLLSIDTQDHHRQGFRDAEVYEFVGSLLHAPSPHSIQAMVNVRFGVDVSPTLLLRRAHHDAIQATAALFSTWVFPRGTAPQPLEPLPSGFVEGIVALMSDDTVPVVTRLHLTTLVNVCHTVPCQPAIRFSFRDQSGELFLASLRVASDAPALVAMRCRLLAEHLPAIECAVDQEWILDSVVAPLQKISMIALKKYELNGAAAAVAEIDVVHVLLSYMASLFSNSAMAAELLPDNQVERLAMAWLALMRVDATHTVAIRCLPHVVRSPAGRRVALFEATKQGEPATRTCFGFAARWCLPYDSAAASAASKRSTTVNAPKPKRNATAVAAALEGLITATTLDTEPFSRALLKSKTLDTLESVLIAADRQHTLPSLAHCKLLSAASFAPDVQVWIAQRSDLLTAVLALASDRPTTEIGTISLLTVRNLCFHNALKVQMCQDTRVLYTMRNALLCLGTSIDPRSPLPTGGLGGGSPPPLNPPLVQLETSDATFQRQEIAARCLWALSCTSERCKAYVRGALQKDPRSGDIISVSGGLRLSSPSSLNKSSLGVTIGGPVSCIPHLEYAGPELQQFSELMTESLTALTQLEVIKSVSQE